MAEKADKRGAAMALKSSATFKVSVLRCRKTGRVLFLEAGKDFVDTLLSFLLLPIGIIIHMLSSAGGQVKALERGVSGIFKSVETLDRSFLLVEKESLLQPLPAVAGAFGSTGLLQGLNAAVTKHPSKDMIELPMVYYQCHSGRCRSLSMTMKSICTDCRQYQYGRPMNVLPEDIDSLKEEIFKKIVEEESSDAVGKADSTNSDQGFVRENITYMVTDSLEVMPSTTIRSIQVLNKLKVTTLTDLESTDINVTVTQILQLLQAAITSSTCLNDVFPKHSVMNFYQPPGYV